MALYVFANIMFRIPISLDEVYKTTRVEKLKIRMCQTTKIKILLISFNFCATYARNKENEEIFVKAYSRLN